ncbi:MAG: DivIVA domain-containing protein [Coriobacteriia bacterium]|nr:DivIVA domain-containing protein [Coriobacteriia bacterium]
MTITALEIQEVRFGEIKKGYDPNEVDEFLERVAADVDTLNRALSEAASRIKAAERRADEAERKLAMVPEAPPVAVPAPIIHEEPAEPAVSGEIIAKAFIAAQKSADALQEEARKEAERVYREAEGKAREIVRDSLAEKQKTIAEFNHLRESCEKFRMEYVALLKYFQADAQKRLAAFDDALQAQSSSPAISVPQGMPPAREVPISMAEAPVSFPAPTPVAAAPDPFAPPSASLYQMSLDDDDLDIEEID